MKPRHFTTIAAALAAVALVVLPSVAHAEEVHHYGRTER